MLRKWLNNTLNLLKTAAVHQQQQVRTTFILKRKYDPLLHKTNAKPRKMRAKHFIYELVEDTGIKRKPDLEVVLTTYVEGVGDKGDVVALRPNFVYNKLLLPGRAVYKTDENLALYSKTEEEKTSIKHSSAFAQRVCRNRRYRTLNRKVAQLKIQKFSGEPKNLFITCNRMTKGKTVNVIERFVLEVVMNKEQPWVIEPWHIKASLRKAGIHCPEECITMPKERIEGPDMKKEFKEFYCTITVNNLEKARLRCRLHHWSTDPSERLPFVNEYWKIPAEPLFGSEAAAESVEVKPQEEK